MHRLTVITATLLTALGLALAPAQAQAAACSVIPTGGAVTDSTVVSSWYRPSLGVTLSSPTGNSIEWQLDGGACTADTPGTTIALGPLAAGTHTLHHRAVDTIGMTASGWIDSTFSVDGTPPSDDTVFPSSAWRSTPVAITVTGSDADSGVGHVEWKVDGALFSGPNPSTFVPPEGSHVISTKVFDVAGNDSGWSANHTVQTDSTGPTDTTAVPSGWQTSAQTVNVTGIDAGGSGIDHVEWQLDGTLQPDGTPTAPTSGPAGSSVPVSSDGKHKLTTRVVDTLSHASAWRTQEVWIDTLVPEDRTAVISGWQTVAPSIDVKGADVTSGVQKVQWQIDGGTIQESTSNPANITISTQGVHELKTRVYDVAGLASGWSTWTVRIDTTAPNNTTPVASSAWRTTDYAVVLNGEDSGSTVAEMRWKLDSNVVQHGPPGTQVNVSGTGAHKLTTWVVDVAGNESAPREDDINIDAIAPTDTTTLPATIANHYVVSVTGNDTGGSGVDHVEFKLDGGSVQTTSAAQIDGAGPHTLQTRVVDTAGNASSWRTQNTTVDLSLSGSDTTKPTDTTMVPSGWHIAPVSVTVTATDLGWGLDHVEWRLSDDGRLNTGPSGSVVTVSGDGDHEIETRAVDLAGNTSDWRTQHVKIDATVPTDTSALPSGWSKTRSFTMNGSDATSGIATIEYAIGAGATQTTSDGGTVTVSGDGTFTIKHRVIDAANNASPWKTDTVKVDTVKPVSTTVAPSTAWQTAALELNLTGTDVGSGVDHYEWRVDGGDVQTGATAEVSADGTHTLETRVVDAAGNASDWQVPAYAVKLDTTLPQNTTPAPTVTWQRQTYTVTVSGTDATSGVDHVEWKIDGGSVNTTPSVTIGTRGLHQLQSRVLDKAGNASAWRTDSIGIDPDAPALSASCGTQDWRASAAVCTITADGGVSGRKAVTVMRANGTAQDVGTDGVYRVDEDGEWPLTIRAVDNAGNDAVTHAIVRVDRTAPSASVTCDPDSGTAYQCTAAAADSGSGLANVTYSVDGGAAQPVTVGTKFKVTKGTVVVTSTDRAGNTAASIPLKLAERKAPETQSTPTPRSRTATVLLVHGHSVKSRMVGELTIASLPSSTTVDLRPLALGKGTFRIELAVTAGKSKKSVRKTVTARAGYTPRIRVKLGGAGRVSVKLIVRRRSGHRWVTHARGAATLG